MTIASRSNEKTSRAYFCSEKVHVSFDARIGARSKSRERGDFIMKVGSLQFEPDKSLNFYSLIQLLNEIM